MDKKKLSAAIAAVFTYVKTSEEAAAYYAPEGLEPIQDVSAAPQQVIQQQNIWGLSGRGAHMQANSMMQLRMFK